MPIRLKDLDVRDLRRRLAMTQREFCDAYGFELATLRHWERGDRKPRGAALILLNVVRHNPGAVRAAILNAAHRERQEDLRLERRTTKRRPYGRPPGSGRGSHPL